MVEINGYHYTECGLDYIWLENGVFQEETPYGNATSIADLDDLHKTIGLSIVRSKGSFSGQEIKFLRHEMDMSQNALSDLLGSNEQTFSRWERNKCVISGPAQKLLSVLYWEYVNGEGALKDILENISELDAKIHDHKLTLARLDEKWQTAA